MEGVSINENTSFEQHTSVFDDEGLFEKVVEPPNEEQEPEEVLESEEELTEPQTVSTKIFPQKPKLIPEVLSHEREIPTYQALIKHSETYAKDRGIILIPEFKNILVRKWKEDPTLSKREIEMFFQGIIQERNVSISKGIAEALEKTHQEMSKLMGIVRSCNEQNMAISAELQAIKEASRMERKELFEAIKNEIRSLIPEIIGVSKTPPAPVQESLYSQKGKAKVESPKDEFWERVKEFLLKAGIPENDVFHETMPTIAHLLITQEDLTNLTDPSTSKESITSFIQWFIENAKEVVKNGGTE